MLSGLQDEDTEVLALKILTIQFQFEQLKEEHIQSDGQGKTKILVAPQNLQTPTEMKTNQTELHDESKEVPPDGSPTAQPSAIFNTKYQSLLMQK